MRFLLKTFLLIFILCGDVFPQQIDSVVYQVNTIGANELQFWIYIRLGSNEVISLKNNFPQFNSEYNISIRKNENDVTAGTGKISWKEIPAFGKYIIGKFDLNRELIKEITDSENQYYLYCEKDIKIIIGNKTDTVKERIISISPSELKSATLNKLIFSEEYFNLLLKKYGDASFLYGNFIDAGAQVETEDSSKSNYVFQFNYNTSLFSSRYFSLAASGRFSTNSNDPLGKFTFYPVYFNYLKFNNIIPFQATFQAGIEGSQNFTIQKMSVAGSLQAIIPNFIDFTGGENRLRLKPILKAGLKDLWQYKNLQFPNSNDGQVFAEIYYYIPVFKIYSLLLQGITFNNFSGGNSGRGWLYQYNFTLGMEVPKVGFKVIAKYTQGSNDINYQYDSQLILGLLMDLFEK